MKRFREVKELPLDQLVIGKTQVRTREVGREIEELAESIRKVGLLEPIVVGPSAAKPGMYEIITGQRRFLAHQEIGASSILAAVLDETVSETEAKVLSLTENLLRRDLNNRDLIDACTALYKKYGSIQDVVKETGLPYNKVSEYVRYDRLVPEVRALVDAGQVRIKDALRAQDAASAASGQPDRELAVRLATEMSTMSGAQQERLLKDRKENPKRSIDEVIEEQKTSKKVVQIVVTLSATLQERLQAFAKEEATTQDDAARSLIEEGLTLKGFSEADD
jgi:ParB family transcriptional regulator, chromosome partitioning protein